MAEIVIEGLTKSYDQKGTSLAVENVNLRIEDGQFVTLLGPSGCGKTTTLRLIAGYLTPDAGSIHVDGKEISAPGHVVPPDKREMGMVFQNYAVWPHKTVRENVVFGLKLRKVDRKRAGMLVDKALEQVNLSGLGDRYPSELSGGQQQRVALARSLVVEPKILLLDEPLSNLDAKLREHMRGELKQLQRNTGITFVYVTHDQSEALALSDMIAVMQTGHLQQFSTPQDVYSRPANQHVADFMGLVNLVEGTVFQAESGIHIKLWNRISIPVAEGREIAGEKSATVAIRPENIIILTDPGNEENIVEGKVEEVVYLGNIVEYKICVSGAELLRVQAHPKELFTHGENVWLSVDVDNCSVFPSGSI